MSQPTPYTRQYSFTNAFASSPTQVFPGASLDLELNTAKATLDQILQNIKLLQNDDGTVKNGTIGTAQLSVALQTGFLPPTVWSSGVAYSASPASTVFINNKFYSCATSHTSGVFATDLAAGKWSLIADLSNIPLQTATNISVTPVGGIVTTDAQSALAGIDTRVTANAASFSGLVAANINDSTATGRALLTTVSTDAALSTLNSWSTGDVKSTLKTAADTGWLMLDDTTFGDASSSATHASATYQALFTLLFNNTADADCAVLTSAGGATTRVAQTNAATAWAAHCRMTLPKALGAVLGAAGAGSGLTSRPLGSRTGAETVILDATMIPSHTHTATVTDPGHTHNTSPSGSSTVSGGGATVTYGNQNSAVVATASATTGVTVANSSTGGGLAHSNVQPTFFVNFMVKL